MLGRKDDVVGQTCSGVEYLMKKNEIKVIHGHGSFETNQKVLVQGEDGSNISVETENVIIATGSSHPVFLGFKLISSVSLLPRKL